MKVFAIKVLFICFCFSLTFHLTLGFFITKYKKSFDYYLSKENIIYQQNILRREIKNILKQDRIFSNEDAMLINQLIDKINSELNFKAK
jgi:hypothetical protein